MRRFYALVVLLGLSTAYADAQTFGAQWARSVGSTGTDLAQAMTTDGSGNVYMVGSFEGTIDVDPSSGVTNLVSAGLKDAFFIKYSSTGALVWANSLGSTGDDEIYSVVVDASGNVYVAGSFTGTVDFDTSPTGTANLTANGLEDAFYGRYSSAGALSWVNRLGSSTGSDYAYTITLESTTHVIVGGVFTGTADFDASSAVLNKTSVGGEDMWFGKFTAAGGAFVWVNAMGSTGNDKCWSLSVASGTVWMSGHYAGTMNINPNGTLVSASNAGGLDGIFSQYSTTTGLQTGSWGTLQGTQNEAVTSIYATATSIYTAGNFQGSVSLYGATPGTGTSVGATDMFVAKHTISSMSIGFFNKMGGSGDDGINALAVDPTETYVYVAGYHNGGTDFDPSATNTSVVAVNGHDGFVARYSTTTGAFNTADYQGCSGISESSFIHVSTAGIVYASGVFEDDIDASTAIAPDIPLVSRGGLDAYVVKYGTATFATEPGSQPSNLSMTNATGYGFDWSFTANGSDGYIGVYRTGAAPTGLPQDGELYDYDDVIGDGTVLFVGSGTTWTWAGALPQTQYHLAIYAYNETGGFRNYRTTTPLTGNITTLAAATQPTSNPTGLSFTNVTTTSATVSFTAASGGAAGYIAFRNTVAPLIILDDGRTFTAGSTTTDGSVVAYVGAATTFTQTGLTDDTEYFYAIYAYNGSGNSINYRQTLPLTGSFTTQAIPTDQTGPVIVDNTPKETTANTAVKVSLTVTDAESGVKAVEVHFYPINSYAYDEQPLVKTTGNTWEYTIPASYVTEQGVEYEIVATNNADIESYINFTQVRVRHADNGLPIPYNSPGTASTNYRIISVPLVLNSASLSAVFEDDLGPADKSKWRIFRYSGTGSSAANKEHTGNIEIGKGYWLISSEQKSIDSGPGLTADVGIGKPFYITLVDGWNQIGNPFNFDVVWSDVVNDTENDDVVVGDLRVFNGQWINGQNLARMSGGFVMSDGGQLYVSSIKPGGRTQSRPKVNFDQPLDAPTWAVNLSLRSGAITNDFGGIGMHSAASEDKDRYDDYTLPRFFEYLELNHGKKLHGSPFTRDIVPTATHHTWSFEVESNLSDEVITLSWDNETFGSNALQLVLWDEAQQRAVDMRAVKSYSFRRGHSKAFRIFFGDSEFVRDQTRPSAVMFHSASPVPATDRITFGFSLPENSENVTTSLEIYNLMGQRVAEVLNETLPAGYHEAVWMIENGRRPAGGVYIGVLKFGNAVAQKRVILK